MALLVLTLKGRASRPKSAWLGLGGEESVLLLRFHHGSSSLHALAPAPDRFGYSSYDCDYDYDYDYDCYYHSCSFCYHSTSCYSPPTTTTITTGGRCFDTSNHDNKCCTIL